MFDAFVSCVVILLFVSCSRHNDIPYLCAEKRTSELSSLKTDALKTQLFSSLASSAQDTVFFTCGYNGEIHYSNEISERFWGRDSNGFPLQSKDWVHPEDFYSFNDAWQAFKSHASDIVETDYRALPQAGGPDGAVRYFHMSVRRSGNAASGVSAGMIRDVTELSQIRCDLMSKVLLHRNVADIVDCMIFIKDASDSLRYIFANKRFCDFFGLDAGTLPGRVDESVFPDYDSDIRKADLRLASGAASTWEGVGEILLNGTTHTLKISKKLITLPDGRRVIAGTALSLTHELAFTRERDSALKELDGLVMNANQINEVLSGMVLNSDYDTHINSLLTMLLHRFDCSQILLCNVAADAGKFSVSRRIVHGGEMETLDSAYDMPQAFLPPLRSNVNIVLPDVSHEADLHGISATGSLVVVPVFFKKRLSHMICLCFSEKGRELSEADTNLLAASAHVVRLSRIHQAQRKAIEDALYEKHIILNNINIPIWLYDSCGRLVTVNPAVTELCGRSESFVLSHPCNTIFCGELDREANCPVMRALRSGTLEFSEYVILGRDYIVSADPILDSEGHVKNVVKSAIDVTEMNENRRRQQEALEAARSADRAKSVFLATMSHELRTPLNAVIGFSELLQDSSLSESRRVSYLESIRNASNTLLTLINDVLDLSKLEANQFTILPEMCDFTSLTNEIRSIFSHAAETKHITVENIIPPSFPEVCVDPLRMRQVLLNIVGNAVKFTSEGGVRVESSYHIESQGVLCLAVTVSDTGQGVPEKNRAHIFEPFVQDEDIRGRHTLSGTGLGLAVSDRIVRLMGGTIRLESEEGVGSRFIMTFPGIRFRSSHSPEVLPSADGGARDFSLYPELRVLVVDDVEMNVKVLSSMLDKLGVRYAGASSGAEALEILKDGYVPDYIMTDMWMPGMDGSALASAVRCNSALSKVKIIAVTADTDAAANFDTRSFDSVLLKPLTLAKLSGALSR